MRIAGQIINANAAQIKPPLLSEQHQGERPEEVELFLDGERPSVGCVPDPFSATETIVRRISESGY